MNIEQKELIIAVIEKDNAILIRKKPEGSLPYKETWYLFGCERIIGQEDSITIKHYLKTELGINADVSNVVVSQDSETKQDHDGIEKNFTYTSLHCRYIGGAPKIPEGAERVEWIPKNKLSDYDLVPPSRKLLKKLGYLGRA